MAQIIKHRRGTLAELNGVTLANGELGVVTSSVDSIGDAVLKTALVVGNTDGTNRLSIGRIIKGNATPNLSGITGGAAFNDMLYHETDAKTLKVLNTGGNTSLDLTGNIADGTVGGTLDVTGRVDAQAGLDVTGSLNIGGNTVLGDASGDSLTINAATINPANIAAGTDNTVVVYNGSTLVTDEIDSKVWDGNLVDTDGSGANNELVTWSDSDSIIGEGNLTFDGSTLTVTGNAVVTSHISSSANITGSAIYASSGFYGDGSNLTGVAQDIDTLTELAATPHATQDEYLISDNGTEKRINVTNAANGGFALVSGDILIAAGGAATIQATSVENSMLADDAVDSDEIASGAVDDDHLSDGVATGLAGAGMTATSGVLNVIGTAGAVSVGADAVTLVAANTTLTSILNASLGKIGTAAAQEYVTFGTANEVNTFINNTERLSVTSAGIDVTGNATISGNLTVNGTQTTISSSIVDIGDNIIQVNGTPVTYGGLHVKDATGNQTGSMVWDTVNNYWKGGISGSEYRVPELASVTELSGNNNRVLISDGTRIDASAAITDDGTTVDISNRVDAQASLQVTGSIYASAGASVAASSASLVSFRNDSTTQLGYLASADTQAVTTGLVGYNTSTGNLTISSVIDGGSF